MVLCFVHRFFFLSATVALRTNFLSLADFKPNLSRTNVKLPSSATWPLLTGKKFIMEIDDFFQFGALISQT